ncbi:MAG: T9SS type A sorting domain-containing protein [Candidatus Kapaibacterium sp.]
MSKHLLRYVLMILAITTISLPAEEHPSGLKSGNPETEYYTQEDIAFPASYDVIRKKNKNVTKLQTLTFTTIDSLANAYSSFNLGVNKTLAYDTQTGTLVHLKRGYYDHIKNPDHEGDNSKNNLFILLSTDWGKTWQEPIITYNADLDDLDEARYPSVYPAKFNDELTIAYSSPRVNEQLEVWYGFINGIYSETLSANNIKANHTFNYSGQDYEYSTVSRIAAFAEPDNPQSIRTIITATVSPTPEVLSLNSNFSYIMSTDLGNYRYVIPSAWSSANFHPVETTRHRANSLVDLIYDKESENLYFAAFGNFVNFAEEGARPGVSVSTDKGETWSDFEVFPLSVLDNYPVEQGASELSFFYETIGFTEYGDGNYSFVLPVNHIQTTGTLREIIKKELCEVYYQDGSWGIRKIADLTSAIMVYADVTNENTGQRQNPGDYEIQLAISEDGQTLLAKWVDLIDYDGSTFDNVDVFAATRKTNQSSWGAAVNITQSDEIDRSTILPDVIPSDLVDIPLLKMFTKHAPELSPEDIRAEQFYAGKEQWLQIAHFNAVVGVEDDKPLADEFKVHGIFPNPAVNEASLNLNMGMPAYVEVEIFDVLGNSKGLSFSGNLSAGLRAVTLDVAGLSSGTYYCRIKSGSKTITEILTVNK